MTATNVVQMAPKALSPKQAAARLQEEGYDQAKHQKLIRESYHQFIALGLRPVLLHTGTKAPCGDEWQKRPIPHVTDFNGYHNIGIITGEPGNNICDVDIDDLEMVKVLPHFLPPTPFKFGRYYGEEKQVLAHWLYRVNDPGKNIKVDRPTGKGAVEVRTNGGQTMAPTSTIIDHKRGYIVDSVRWAGGKTDVPKEPIPETTRDYLNLCVRVAMCSHFAIEYFKSGKYHDDMLYWCGFLIAAGVPDDLVEKSVLYIMDKTGQTDIDNRMDSLKTTRQRHSEGENVAGIGYLYNSDRWSKPLCKWLSQTMKVGGKDLEDPRPLVKIISSREPQWLDHTLTAMVQTQKFYQMSGQACIVTKVENKATIIPLDKSVNAASWLTREIRFTQSNMDKATGVITDQEIKCPTSLALEIADATTYKGDLPTLNGVSNTPIITPSGRVVEDAWGYDPELRLFFSSEFAVQPMFPDEALPILKDVLCDFPFIGGAHGRYSASALSAILTAVIRPVLDICPLYVITSSQYSDGKSVLSGVIAASAGVEQSLGQLTRGGSDEEQEKQLSAILSRGRRVVTLDNHDGDFRSAALTEALTSMHPEFRILGKNETRSVPNKTMFLLNGVNTAPSLDLQTRSVFVRLARTNLDPDRRFKYMDVVGHTLANRARMVSATIALIKWAMEQGDGKWKPNHRFKTWDFMVRRTVQIALGVDIAPPPSEDEDRTIDSSEEARHSLLLHLLGLWNLGMRNDKGKLSEFFRTKDLSVRINLDSEEESWINTLSKRPKQDINVKVGYALNAVKDFPFSDENGVVWRLASFARNGLSAYKMEKL